MQDMSPFTLSLLGSHTQTFVCGLGLRVAQADLIAKILTAKFWVRTILQSLKINSLPGI